MPGLLKQVAAMALLDVGAKLVKRAASAWLSRPSPYLFLRESGAHVGVGGISSFCGVTCSSIFRHIAAHTRVQRSFESCPGSQRWRQQGYAGSWSVAAFTACRQPLHHFSGGRIVPMKRRQKAEETETEETAVMCNRGRKSAGEVVDSKEPEREGGLENGKSGLQGIIASQGGKQGGGVAKEKQGMGSIGPGKVCIECQVTKPLRNFEKSIPSPDGRHILCRACLAKFRSERKGRGLHHLAMPVAEAWERAKVCTRCQQVQEMREFSRDIRRKDGLQMQCCSCYSEHNEQLPDKPVAETAWCTRCGLKKPACRFSRNKGSRSGLNSICLDCTSALLKESRKFGPALRMHFQVQEKRCSMCRLVKASEAFYRDSPRMDGLKYMCKGCSKSEAIRWARLSSKSISSRLRAGQALNKEDGKD